MSVFAWGSYQLRVFDILESHWSAQNRRSFIIDDNEQTEYENIKNVF